MNDNPVSGFNYLLRGAKLLTAPSLRLFIVLPLAINFIIFSIALYFTFNQISALIEQLMAQLWDWLDFLRWIIWPMVIALVLVVVMYSFSMVANIIAAPFNGLLAEKAEELLTGEAVAGAEGLSGAIKDAPRSIFKELRKIGYYLKLAIPIALVAVIFVFAFPPAATAIWFLLGAWMLALEYCDYPMDNHRHSLQEVRLHLARRRLSSLSFGSGVMLGTMVPIVNLFVMPAAVCGATIYWVEELKKAPKDL